ncbi:MAG: hypothetical protein AAB304_01605 [Pseudomonadota bacterium]
MKPKDSDMPQDSDISHASSLFEVAWNYRNGNVAPLCNAIHQKGKAAFTAFTKANRLMIIATLEKIVPELKRREKARAA